MTVFTRQVSPGFSELLLNQLIRSPTKTTMFPAFSKVHEILMEAISFGMRNLFPVNVLALVTYRLGFEIEIGHDMLMSE